MSNAFLRTNSGNLPPDVPISFETQNGTPPVADGTATPAANIIKFGSTSNDTNTTDGIVASGSSNLVNYALTNRFRQTTTTSNAATSTVTILSALTAGVYVLDVKVAANATVGGPAGVGYTIVGAVRSTAGVAVLIPGQQRDAFEEAGVTTGNAIVGVSGNTITVTVTGIAAFDFNWLVTGEYILIS